MAAVAAGQRPSANTTTAAAALLQATAIAQRRASLSPGPTAVASRAATPLQRPASSTPPLSTTAAGARKRKTPTKAATTPKAPKGSGKKKRPADAGGAGGGAGEGGGGPRRVFTCEKCQRSYDWNYNLNRHRKYECGKENAFQCAKCGRKFPHKQNCVYHLKRKHKIVCDTIDQYVSSGLVLFRGQAGRPGSRRPTRPTPRSDELVTELVATRKEGSKGLLERDNTNPLISCCCYVECLPTCPSWWCTT